MRISISGCAFWNAASRGTSHSDAKDAYVATVTRGGPLIVHTGLHTARSATDKFIVREPSTEGHVWWGQYNRPFAP
ncbi:MAG: phosphoenolpyruvate carboxykinase (ATP), partial [Pseudomonadota bacterium]